MPDWAEENFDDSELINIIKPTENTLPYNDDDRGNENNKE